MIVDHTAHKDRVVFVSGANRGIGRAIVAELLKHPVKRVYAAARNLQDLPAFGDARVTPVALDITNVHQVRSAASFAGDVQVLINNAGTLAFAPIVAGKPEDLMRDMQVNYFGTISMVQHFAPVIEKNGGGLIANVLSVVSLASMSAVGGYSASKAALFSATQAMRAELKSKGIKVCGIFPGPIDTDMAKEFQMDKASPQTTAQKILAGLAEGHEDIFPDAMSEQISQMWARDPKALEKQFASM